MCAVDGYRLYVYSVYLALVHVPWALVEVRIGGELSYRAQHSPLIQFQVSCGLGINDTQRNLTLSHSDFSCHLRNRNVTIT